MKYGERAVTFACEDERLVGVVAIPERPLARGVLIVVGGPQYRAGSHRQFVLLARFLAQHGIASMRFDYRGMGDSSGDQRNFEHVDADLRAAADRFMAEVPDLAEIVIWGLCDGASAAMLRAHRDERVTGLVLLNPWVRTDVGEAKTYLKHYYLWRVIDPAFWHKAVAGRLDVKASVVGLAHTLKRAVGGAPVVADDEPRPATRAEPLPERLAFALERFRGRVLLVLSGNDLTAKEFTDVVASSPRWQALLGHARVTRVDLPEANHTFSTRAWRDVVNNATLDWVRQWPEKRC